GPYASASTAHITSPGNSLSRPSNSVNFHSWAIQSLKNLAPFWLVIWSTWTLPTRRLDITNITPRRVKHDDSVTMKLGSPVLLTIKPLNHPTAAAARNADPMAQP